MSINTWVWVSILQAMQVFSKILVKLLHASEKNVCHMFTVTLLSTTSATFKEVC